MPRCPVCQASCEAGQRYCEHCESYLLDPEEGDYFCPQCGIRVARSQEICHKCSAKLPEIQAAPVRAPEAPAPPAPEPPPPAPPPAPSPPPGPRLPLWALGALIGSGFLIIFLLGLLLRQGLAPPKVVEVPFQPAAPAAPATPASPAPEASLADQVTETLNTLREAQLKNDIILFMSCYSYLYPSLDKKRQQTLAYLKDYKFLDLNFILDEVKPLGSDEALARVTWTLQVQNRKSREFDSFTQVYLVVLAQELGQWRVRSIKNMTYGDSGRK